MADIERRRLRVTGRVQGVGFRYFTLAAARRHALTGFVRNEMDGSVLCEAQGDPRSLDLFETDLRRGPSYSRVDGLESEDLGVRQQQESGFAIH